MATGAIARVDVLVIGAGPAGASAARIAAEQGVTTLVVERRARIGEPVQCAEFVPRPLAPYSRAPGVWLQAIEGMKSYLPSGAVEHTEFGGIMIDRARFDQAIAARARDAGAEIWTDTQCVGLEPGKRIARLRRAGGSEMRVRWGVLIAADGPNSTVARALGLRALETVDTRQYTVPLSQRYADTDIFLSDAFPGGYGWLFPKGELANLGVGADRRYRVSLKQALDDLHAQLHEAGRVGARILSRTGGRIPVGGLRDPLVLDAVVFAGDAAGLTHPITGAGIAAAVASGEAAGAAAAEWLGGTADVLEEYAEEIRAQYEPSLTRAVERRAELKACWRTPAAAQDLPLRRGWIAFDEYYGSSL